MHARLMMRLCKFLLLAALCQACSPLLRAAELTTIEQILRINAIDAGQHPRDVQLSGTVVDVGTDQRVFSLHDGTHTTCITLPSGISPPKLGDTAKVSGVTHTFRLEGRTFPRVTATNLIVTASSALPSAPAPVTTEEINSFRNFDQWVSTQGYVARWKYRSTDRELVIVLVDATGFTTVSVRTNGRASLPTVLTGAKLRVTGVNYNKNTLSAYGSVIVPSLEQMQILIPGNDQNAYAFPTTSAADIAAGEIPIGTRVIARGIVLGGKNSDEIFLRDGSHALSAKLFPPWGNNLPYEEYHDGGPWPVLQPGDEIEIVGSLMQDTVPQPSHGISLHYCYARAIGKKPTPAAIPTTLSELSTGRHAHDLVQVRARLLSLHQISSSVDSWRTTMMLESDGITMPLIFESPAFIKTHNLRVDDEILVTAIVNEANSRDPHQLHLRSLADVQSLGTSPSVRAKQFQIYGIGTLVLLAILSAWIIHLRRVNRQKSQITAAMQAAHDKARESEKRWKLLFEQSPLSVQIFSPDGQTIRFNQAWKNLFKLTDEQGYAFNVLQAPDLIASGAVEHIRKAFHGEAVLVPPVPFPIPGDPPETRWIGGVLYPLHNDDGTIVEVVTVHHDITDSKRAEEALQKMNLLLEQRVADRTLELEQARLELQRALEKERELGELKSRFVTTVSHEFRTPLGIIMSSVELLQHYAERLSQAEKDRQLSQIHANTKHMGGLMEQVLLLGRAEAGKLSFKPAALDIVTLVNCMIDEMRSFSHEHCPITLHCPDDLDGAVADEALLRHILSNLLSNAVKYSPPGAAVTLTLQRQHHSLVIQVIDQGIGIPEKDQAHLFEAFHRGSNVADQSGTGLGLVIVKNCVEAHGGTITFHTSTGQGTTFTVTLPVYPAS
jgi:signal transduction histidine kinase